MRSCVCLMKDVSGNNVPQPHVIDTPKYLKRRTATKFDETYVLSGNTEITSDKRLIHKADTAYNTNAGLIFTKRQLTAAEDTGKSITAVLRWKSPSSFNTSFHDYVFACGRGAIGGPYPLNLRLYSGDFHMSGGSGSDSYVNIGNKLETNTWYWIKLVYTKIGTSSAWTSYYCLDNGREPLDNEYTQLLTTNRNWTPLGASSSYPDCDYIRLGIHYTNSGSIGETQYDLTKCYIKVGDEYIYKGQYTDVDYQAGTKNNYDLIIPQKNTINVQKYLKKIITETPFVQPTLSANGTIGGDSFAVEKVGNSYNGDAYQTFDGSTSTAFRPYVNNGLIFYNPKPINITNLACNVAYSNEGILKGELYASNDNSTWKLIDDNIGGAQTWSTNINMQGSYKYFKLMSTSVTGGRGSVAELIITATEYTEVWQTGTPQDYTIIV